jgi:hypothetical protein
MNLEIKLTTNIMSGLVAVKYIRLPTSLLYKVGSTYYPSSYLLSLCNDPKPLCKDHHSFGVFLKLFSGCGISSNSLLIYLFRCVYMCVCSK